MLICAILVSADVLASYRPELPVATPADGAAYLVTDILPRYVEEHPDHPPLDSDLEVELGEVSDGYVAPREDVPSARIRLKRQRDRGPVRFYASALAAINRSIVGQLNRRGLAGIRVQTDPSDIDPVTGEDRRAPGQRSVHLDIATGRISGLRAVEVEAFGLRAGEESSSDSPFHRRVLEGSPIQPRDSAREGTTDLLRIDKLEDYVAQLNRYPSRAVVAEITPGWITPESTYLDYKIIEERPWTLYSQVSRSGTEETHRWRQRFGFRHTQLRGGDDTLPGRLRHRRQVQGRPRISRLVRIAPPGAESVALAGKPRVRRVRRIGVRDHQRKSRGAPARCWPSADRQRLPTSAAVR